MTTEPIQSPGGAADVSVIIPAYRAAGTIVRALKSVAQQTCKPAEVIVVDDGSDDGTAEVARGSAGRLAGIQLLVFTQGNFGAGAARNRAVRESSGRYLAFLDADDEWLPEKLEASLNHLISGDYTFVAHNGWVIDGETTDVIDGARHFNEAPEAFSCLYRKGYIDTCTVVARRDAVVAAGGFDETLPNAQDFDLWLAMAARPNARFAVFADVLSRYYVIPGSIMSHTRRRLACCLVIARRYMFELKQRPGFGLASVWYRTLVVHAEAFDAYWRNHQRAAALSLSWRAAGALIAMTVHYIFARPVTRADFIQREGEG